MSATADFYVLRHSNKNNILRRKICVLLIFQLFFKWYFIILNYSIKQKFFYSFKYPIPKYLFLAISMFHLIENLRPFCHFLSINKFCTLKNSIQSNGVLFFYSIDKTIFSLHELQLVQQLNEQLEHGMVNKKHNQVQ